VRQKDDKKVEHIFDATLQLVEQTGLAGITMCDISKAAGIATGTLYIYFKNKEELINELFTVCRRESAELYFEDLQSEDGFENAFRKMFMNIIEYKTNNFREAIFMDQCFHSPFVGEKKRKESAKFMQPYFELIEKGKKLNIIKNKDELFLLWFLIGTINEVIKGCRYRRKALTDEMVEDLYQMCWEGIKQSGVDSQ
jgi:TetR/AcrR family transcriptional regulator, repressor of fatR-cypB operon